NDGKVISRQESRRDGGGWYANATLLTRDGKRLVASGHSYANQMHFPSLRVWDLDGLTEIRQWPIEGLVVGFAEKDNIVLLNTPKGVQQVDLESGRELELFPLPKGAQEKGPVAAVHRKTAVVRTMKQDRLLVYDMTAPEKAKTLELPERGPSSIAFSPDGKIL